MPLGIIVRQENVFSKSTDNEMKEEYKRDQSFLARPDKETKQLSYILFIQLFELLGLLGRLRRKDPLLV